jgi:hypothetical protein
VQGDAGDDHGEASVGERQVRHVGCPHLDVGDAPYLRPISSVTFTRLMRTGTSTRGAMTVAKTPSEFRPNTAALTAMANSMLLRAEVKLRVAAVE